MAERYSIGKGKFVENAKLKETNNVEMCFAPIMIPTLNRDEHLRRCINSLKKNSLAAETDIYISVDFPPNEKYQEGYDRVRKFLKEEFTTGFRNIFVYYQTTNLGPDENCRFLWERVFEKHDTFIFTEDDNEFSPNFLEYMNECLIEFEKDETVFAICSYLGNHSWIYSNENVIFLPSKTPYGFASWKFKYENFHEWLSWKNLLQLLRDKAKCQKIFNTRYKVYYTLMEALLVNRNRSDSVYVNKSGELASIDYMTNIYLLAFEMKCVFPIISKSRNHGMDGTGVNSPKDDTYDPYKIEIDQEDTFTLIVPSNGDIYNHNLKLFKEENYRELAIAARKWRRVILIFGCDIARILRIICYETNKLIKRIRK